MATFIGPFYMATFFTWRFHLACVTYVICLASPRLAFYSRTYDVYCPGICDVSHPGIQDFCHPGICNFFYPCWCKVCHPSMFDVFHPGMSDIRYPDMCDLYHPGIGYVCFQRIGPWPILS